MLDRLGVALDPVCRVRRAARVVVGERNALGVAKEPGPEVQDQPLLDPGLQKCVPQRLEQGEQRDGQDKAHSQGQQGARRVHDRFWHKRGDEARKRVGADHAVHRDPERQRCQERERTGQQAEQEQGANVRPVGARLA